MGKEPISLKIIFILLVFFSFGLSVLSYVRTNSIVDAAKVVNHSNLIKLDLNNVFSNLRDMESGMRGYLITKDPYFLEHYEEGRNIIAIDLYRLDSLTKDNLSQQKNLVALKFSVQKKFGYMKEQRNEDAKKILYGQNLLRGKAYMDEVGTKINKMLVEEDKLLEKRSSALDKKTLQRPIITIILAIISISILVIFYLRIMKNLNFEVIKKTRELADSIESLKQKNLELTKLNKELESFSYISSNDLQEPLRKIQIFASKIDIEEHKNLSENVQYSLKKVKESAKRMQTLIQDFMAYSRTSKEGFKFEDINLGEVLTIVKMDLMEDLNKQNVTIEANELCMARIIPSQFRQLLNNLIGNSLKYANPRTPLHIIIKGSITKGSKLENDVLIPEKNYCLFTLSDNGIGFDPKYNERIFGIFNRLHVQNEYEGTGMGLSIVKKIVENHYGFVTASGMPGKGATIEIIIPSPYVEIPAQHSLV